MTNDKTKLRDFSVIVKVARHKSEGLDGSPNCSFIFATHAVSF